MTYYAYKLTATKKFFLAAVSTSLGDTYEDLKIIAQQHHAALIWINNQFYYVNIVNGPRPLRPGDSILNIPWTAELENKLLNMVNE